MSPLFLLRMVRLARNPPRTWKVLFVFAVILGGLGLAALEHFVGWPDWLTTNQLGRRGIRPGQ